MAARAIIGGWGISGVSVFQKGLPQGIGYSGSDTLGLTAGTNRPNLVGPISYPKTQLAWFNANQPGQPGPFTDPVAPWFGGPNQGFGAMGKDKVVGPGLNNTNLT